MPSTLNYEELEDSYLPNTDPKMVDAKDNPQLVAKFAEGLSKMFAPGGQFEGKSPSDPAVAAQIAKTMPQRSALYSDRPDVQTPSLKQRFVDALVPLGAALVGGVTGGNDMALAGAAGGLKELADSEDDRIKRKNTIAMRQDELKSQIITKKMLSEAEGRIAKGALTPFHSVDVLDDDGIIRKYKFDARKGTYEPGGVRSGFPGMIGKVPGTSAPSAPGSAAGGGSPGSSGQPAGPREAPPPADSGTFTPGPSARSPAPGQAGKLPAEAKKPGAPAPAPAVPPAKAAKVPAKGRDALYAELGNEYDTENEALEAKIADAETKSSQQYWREKNPNGSSTEEQKQNAEIHATKAKELRTQLQNNKTNWKNFKQKYQAGEDGREFRKDLLAAAEGLRNSRVEPGGVTYKAKLLDQSNKMKKALENYDMALDEAKKIDTLAEMAKTNPPAAASLATTMARAAGEKGALSNQDVAQFGGSKALDAKLARFLSEKWDGTLPAEDIKFIQDLGRAFAKNSQNGKARITDSYVGSFHETYGGDKDEVRLKMTGEKLPNASGTPREGVVQKPGGMIYMENVKTGARGYVKEARAKELEAAGTYRRLGEK